jgi:hypothetical protein
MVGPNAQHDTDAGTDIARGNQNLDMPFKTLYEVYM